MAQKCGGWWVQPLLFTALATQCSPTYVDLCTGIWIHWCQRLLLLITIVRDKHSSVLVYGVTDLYKDL